MKILQLEPFEAICGKTIACKAVAKEINYVEGTGTLNECVLENCFRISRMVTAASKINEVYGDHFFYDRWDLPWNGWTKAKHKHRYISSRNCSINSHLHKIGEGATGFFWSLHGTLCVKCFLMKTKLNHLFKYFHNKTWTVFFKTLSKNWMIRDEKYSKIMVNMKLNFLFIK